MHVFIDAWTLVHCEMHPCYKASSKPTDVLNIEIEQVYTYLEVIYKERYIRHNSLRVCNCTSQCNAWAKSIAVVDPMQWKYNEFYT